MGSLVFAWAVQQRMRQFFAALLRDQMQLEVVAECGTVAEAIEAIRRTEPTLVVLDWALPDGKGFDIVHALGPQLRRTRWLCVSSNEQEHMIKESVELGVQGFVLKRADVETLRKAVNTVLEGGTYYCPQCAQLYMNAMRSQSTMVASNLSPRERQVLRAYGRGENMKAAAARLNINVKTVNNLMSSIREKLGIQEPAALVRYAIKHGYAEEP